MKHILKAFEMSKTMCPSTLSGRHSFFSPLYELQEIAVRVLETNILPLGNLLYLGEETNSLCHEGFILPENIVRLETEYRPSFRSVGPSLSAGARWAATAI